MSLSGQCDVIGQLAACAMFLWRAGADAEAGSQDQGADHLPYLLHTALRSAGQDLWANAPWRQKG